MQGGVAERTIREKEREQGHMAAKALRSNREPSAAIGSKLLASTAGTCRRVARGGGENKLGRKSKNEDVNAATVPGQKALD